MDLHRPGATSYSPFDNKGELGDTDSAPAPGPAPAPESVPGEGEEAPPVESEGQQASASHNLLTPEEENRRRLYLNVGRPRPFYRVSPPDVGGVGGSLVSPANTAVVHHNKYKVMDIFQWR